MEKIFLDQRGFHLAVSIVMLSPLVAVVGLLRAGVVSRVALSVLALGRIGASAVAVPLVVATATAPRATPARLKETSSCSIACSMSIIRCKAQRH
jgi:hypothetical protein